MLLQHKTMRTLHSVLVKRRRRAFILAWGSAPGMWTSINQALKARLIVPWTHSFDESFDDATYGEYGFR